MTGEQYLERCLALYDQGNLEEAMDAFDQAIALNPWSLPPYHYLHAVRAELETERPLKLLDAEIDGYDLLLKTDPEDVSAHMRRGWSRYRRAVLSGEPDDLEQAIADLDRAIELEDDNAEAFHHRGLAYHLQGLEYIGIAQWGFDAEGFEHAIRNYDRAIALDPGIARAYHDRGTAYAQRSLSITRDTDETPEEVHRYYQQAFRDFGAALGYDPDAEETYLNRAFLDFILSDQIDEEGQDPADNLQRRLGDSTRIIELNPQNIWGYFFRALAYSSARGSAEDESTAALMESRADEDFEVFDRLGKDLLQRFNLSDLATRVLTLSTGPPIDPRAPRTPPLAGRLEGDTYTSSDGSFRLKLPDLMQPGAMVWDEVTSSGDLLVWLEDDMARWYSLQVHPGHLGRESLQEWAAVNLAVNLDTRQEYDAETPLGTGFVLVYRYAEIEADCSTILAHHDEHFYAATYCLQDHYAGEDDEASMRTFGALYGIDIEPVNELAEEFIRGLEILDDSK
jgi:tetratricopeptide (TPR) repeat protein